VFVDQKDERKLIVLVSATRNFREKWICKGFLLLPSVFLGAPTRHAEVQT
jgi:hypothetical protein